MTDDRARRIRDIRKRSTGGGEDDGHSADEADAADSNSSDAEESSPAEPETADVEDVEDADEASSDDESTDGATDNDGAANGRDDAQPSDSGHPSTQDVSESAAGAADDTGVDTDASGETVSYDETEATAEMTAPPAQQPAGTDSDGQPTRAAEATGSPQAAGNQGTTESALGGAIASSSATPMVEDVGQEPTVDASAMLEDTDGYGDAAVGRENAVFEQGNSLIHSAHEDENTVQMLEFFLNENRYAIEIDRISAIVEMKDITRFPRGPDAIDGVTDLRGEITGVLDPTTMLDVEHNELTDDQYIVVLTRDDDKQKLGIRVSDVSQAVTYRDSQIDETGSVMDAAGSHQHECVKGIIKKTADDQTRLVAWLDIDQLIENTG
ncbi:chemotaxis protein CheW [Natronorubrum sp. JWXQ-INN-674]|uniref:Chemotaxis protein CheW n=1 Tax=Natronorubrum halalkaliphilum TaxID=2691917 RepID=A0A6B0VL02_9EURY|nr:chemotaxis protein CheW [Natronorubrum halalkaliphilum]MXV61787.1 chemotaxis protein CheW [Natronorubrum halalkaliphilum]